MLISRIRGYWVKRRKNMSRAQDYFDRSKVYAAAAQIASGAGSRARLLQLAQHWAHLGKLADRNDLRFQALATGHGPETFQSRDGVGRNSAF